MVNFSMFMLDHFYMFIDSLAPVGGAENDDPKSTGASYLIVDACAAGNVPD